MSNHFPAPFSDDFHISSLSYFVAFAVSAISASFQWNAGVAEDPPVQSGPSAMPAGSTGFCFIAFDTGVDGSGNVEYDYSGFDQDSFEAGLQGVLNSVVSVISATTGDDSSDVQSQVTVYRLWEVEANKQLSSLGSDVPFSTLPKPSWQYLDTMTLSW